MHLYYTLKYVYLFNSLPQPRQVVVNIPIEADLENGVKIFGSGNQVIRCQLSPFLQSKSNINQNKHFVSFKLNIGPLAFEKVRLINSNDLLSENNCFPANINIYNMKNPVTLSTNYKVIYQNPILSNFITMENSLNKVYINSSTGFIELIENSFFKTQYKLNIIFKKYGIKQARETSGAYIFLPDGDGKIIESNTPHGIIHVQGQLYEEVIVKTQYFTHFLRLYKVDGHLANAIDIENEIDISKEFNFEISMVLLTNFIIPSDQFYIDSNCFQFNRRKTLKKLPVQGNVYPMTCGSYLESKSDDKIHRMSLFSKQSNGIRGGIFGKTEETKFAFLEVFLDRILHQDDNRGLFESLIDNKIVFKNYRLLIEGWKQEKYVDHELGELTISGYQLLNDLIYPLHQMYVNANFTNQIATNFVGQKSLLTGFGLPCDYQMVNFQTHLNEFPKLTIHRLKINCEASYISEGSCRLSRKKSPLIKSMFDDLTIKFVNKFQLTGVTSDMQNILPEDINIELMELETFEVRFDS